MTEMEKLRVEQAVERKISRRRTFVLGILALAVFAVGVAGLLVNLTRISNDTSETLAGIEIVQEEQGAGAQRSYVILGNVQCSSKAASEFNAQITEFLIAALNEDPTADALLRQLQADNASNLEECKALLPQLGLGD